MLDISKIFVNILAFSEAFLRITGNMGVASELWLLLILGLEVLRTSVQQNVSVFWMFPLN